MKTQGYERVKIQSSGGKTGLEAWGWGQGQETRELSSMRFGGSGRESGAQQGGGGLAMGRASPMRKETLIKGKRNKRVFSAQ